MRRYESVIILDPEIPDEEIQGFTEKFTSLIKTSGGEIIKIEDWGAKKLAYPVKKRDRGRYLLLDFVGLPALIAELERQFKITEEVMKFLSVKVADEVDLGAFTAAEKPASPAAEPEAPAVAEQASEASEPEKAAGAQGSLESEPQSTIGDAKPDAPLISAEPMEHGIE
ncbi:MAG: 30S ribosomal protein S6 [Desulfomonilaceae bacterium]